MRSSIYKADNNSKPKDPRVIAVTSGKGGVGKTNITVNLAMALSSMGFKVVIFDADLGLANVEVLLGLTPQHTIYDFLFNGKTIDEIMIPVPNNVKLISGGCGLLELANLSTVAVKHLQDSLANLDLNADFILVDTGAGINKNVLAFVAAAQEILVVLSPEPTSLTDAYGLIKVMSRYKVHNEINVLVNMAGNTKEADATFYKIQTTAERFLPDVNIKYLGAVPNDDIVVKAVKDQQPFVLYKPNSTASIAVKAIANQLIGYAEVGETKRGGITGFFGRLSRLFR